MEQERQKEQQILIRAMHSAYFTKHVLAQNVGALIHNPLLRELANVCVRYYGVTDEPLTLDTLNVKLEQRLKLKAKRNQEEVNENALDQIFQLNSRLLNAKEDNNEVLLKDLETYIHNQLANEAIVEEAAAGDDQISERVAKRLDDINSIKLTGTKYEPLDIINDLDRKEEIYKKFGAKRIPSGLKPLDILTSGGLEIGQIGLIAAPSGQGKSTFLTNLTYYYAMKSKRNVLHISLEELETDQVLRFDRVMTNASVDEVFYRETGEIKPEFISRMKNFYGAVNAGGDHGQIYFEKSTPLTLSVDDLRQMVNSIEREKGTKIEVIILDYADLLKKQAYSDSEAQAGELLFQDLVKLAQETNTLIFTATQLNRGSGLAEVKTMDNIEGSYRKKNTIAFGATINATPEERKKGYVRLYLDKVRNNYGFDDNFLYLQYDKRSMRIHAENQSTQADHKATIESSNPQPARAKINKDSNLEDVINAELNKKG